MKRFSAAIIVLILAGLTVLPGTVFAQYKNERDASIPLEHFYIEHHGAGIFRKILSKVTWGLSTGYGHNTLRHELSGFGILQNPDSIPKLFQRANVNSGYSNWTNRVQPSGNTLRPGAFLVNSDTASIGFRSKGYHIPLKGTVHVEFDRYRIGGGYSYEFTHVGPFRSLTYSDRIDSFDPEVSNFFLKKYFGMIGANVYRYYEYLLVVDANIGGYKLGKRFDNAVIQRGIYYNLGVAVEREMSEYFRLFVRPSYEFRKYSINMAESGQSIDHRFNAWYINIGATYRIPELRRCFIKNCRAQLNHVHGNREYRSRVHPIYKKQNPHYGENYPTLIKYKGKNKKKLNPY